MKVIYKYHLFEKRDGSIVNKILLGDGTIINDNDEMLEALMEVLKVFNTRKILNNTVVLLRSQNYLKSKTNE